MFVCGGIAFLASGYIAFYTSQIYKASPSPPSAASQTDFSSKFNTIAPTFDLSIASTEKYMGLPKKRKKLVSQARGDVLEVSIGTGRNLEYYDWDFKGVNGVGSIKGGNVVRGKVRSFTAVDASAEMLEVAHEKFSKLYPGVLGVRWVVGDASLEIPPPPRNANERSGNLEGKKYDTVVQTMGLCSVKDPVALLKNLGNCVEEEEGRILLLEHGRGRWGWLNRYLDASAEGHAREFGCWWNRDLGEIVRESGLEVVQVKRWHLGSTWQFELKKGRTAPNEEEDIPKVQEVTTPVEKDYVTKSKGWW